MSLFNSCLLPLAEIAAKRSAEPAKAGFVLFVGAVSTAGLKCEIVKVATDRGEKSDMNAHAFRYFYDYHFAENRKIWDEYITPLTSEQFTQNTGYSHGSVRDQIVHLMNVDEVWFAELRGVDIQEQIEPAAVDDRESIRARWDSVEQAMRDYLAGLRDDRLFEKPITEPDEDKDLILWQVLLHVANHGTDHRAQLLRLLHDLGVKTTSQDLIFYVYDHL